MKSRIFLFLLVRAIYLYNYNINVGEALVCPFKYIFYYIDYILLLPVELAVHIQDCDTIAFMSPAFVVFLTVI